MLPGPEESGCTLVLRDNGPGIENSHEAGQRPFGGPSLGCGILLQHKPFCIHGWGGLPGAKLPQCQAVIGDREDLHREQEVCARRIVNTSTTGSFKFTIRDELKRGSSVGSGHIARLSWI